MASRATLCLTPIFRSGFRSSQTAFRASGRRGMATNTTSPSTQSNDMPWIIGSGLVFFPTVAWILSSGKGEKHAHPTPKALKEHTKVAEAVEESPREHPTEPITAEPTPESVSEEKPAEVTLEPNTSESVVRDDEGVVVSSEEVEESINKAVDADVPKEAKAVETAPEATSPESEPMKDEALAPPKEEGTKSTPPPVSENTSTEKKENESH